jgi:hypothetical protein
MPVGRCPKKRPYSEICRETQDRTHPVQLGLTTMPISKRSTVESLTGFKQRNPELPLDFHGS